MPVLGLAVQALVEWVVVVEPSLKAVIVLEVAVVAVSQNQKVGTIVVGFLELAVTGWNHWPHLATACGRTVGSHSLSGEKE